MPPAAHHELDSVHRFTDPAYAEQLRKGIAMDQATPSSTLRSGRPAGPDRPHTTHISVIDAQGSVATHTGTGCIAFAGHLAGKAFLLAQEYRHRAGEGRLLP